MPIRITGMYSGLDTEAIISELASAQSMKKNSLVKKQISLSWKMDAWKALNTKIYSFYSKTLDNMRFQGSYALKATKVSGSSVSVTTKNNAVNGVQNLKIEQMAKEGYLTGGKISATASTKLSDLGIEEGSFSVAVGDKSVKIDVTGDMKISDVVSKLQNAGLNASFDEKNQRFFVSSKKSGEKYDFNLIGDDAAGTLALSKLGLLTNVKKNPEYAKWADYYDATKKEYSPAYNTALEKEIASRAASYKKANENLKKVNDELEEKIEALKKEPGYQEGLSADVLYDKLYGPLESKTDEDGNEYQERTGGLKEDLDEAKAKYEESLTDESLSEAEKEQRKEAYEALQEEFDTVYGQYSIAKDIKGIQEQIKANDEQIKKNATYFEVNEDEESGKVTISGTEELRKDIVTEFDTKIQAAQSVLAGEMDDELSQSATKIDGQDAKITLNGADFQSESNTFDINGLEITVLEETDETITLSTGEDIDGIYNMIKNFLTEYNKLINEMDALYNADSAKGYDPLLTEEKDGLSDSEIEEWEKKIKDSILRRDQTLGDVSGAISNAMLAGAEVNGVQMFLSQFGINTLGYFNAADNEKRAYHIDGDPDDANTMSEDDVLRSMIASDPDTVMNFFSQLSKNLYDELGKQMAGTTASSAFTVYNDKTMKDEYDAYTEKIAKQETKLNNLMDKWYKKFSSMETAMAKLQSKNNAISSMLGG